MNQSAGLIIGRTYKVTFDLVSVTASGIRPYVGGAGTGTLRTSVGTYSENIVSSGILDGYTFKSNRNLSNNISYVSNIAYYL